MEPPIIVTPPSHLKEAIENSKFVLYWFFFEIFIK